MTKRISIIILSVTLFLFSVGSVHAATYAVTIFTDELDGGATPCTDIPSDCSLREAVQQANGTTTDDVITLLAGTYTLSIPNVAGDEDSNATGDLDFRDTTGSDILSGAGAASTIINAQGVTLEDRAIEAIASTNVTIDNLTIQGGNAIGSESGGGISTLSTFTIDSVNVINNTTAQGGGGIYKSGIATLTITDSTFSSNTSGVNDVAGGMYISGGDADITRTNINNNQGGVNAGGIYFGHQDYTLTLTDSSVTNNTMQNSTSGVAGGGILSVGNTNIVRSTISGNSSSRGAGIAMSSCWGNTTVDINNFTIANNSATHATFGRGGGLYASCNNAGVYTTTINISHSTIIGNSTALSSGAGIYLEDGGDDTVDLNIKNTIISDNTADSVAHKNCTTSLTNGLLTSNGYNIDSGTTCIFANTGDQESTDPKLAVAGLEDNGGETYTIALQGTSPAKDAGTCTDNSATTVITDQRGNSRPNGSACDIGAFEADSTGPVVTLTGASTVSLECSTTYTDAGSTALDNNDGSVSTNIDTSALDEDTPGSYSVEHSATDTDDNTGTATRTVNVTDTIDPTVTLVGASAVSVDQGDTYTDAGVTTADTCDASPELVTDNPVDSDTPGIYTITYTATDASSNSTNSTRTVTVVELVDHGNAVSITPLKNNKVKIKYEDGLTETFTAFNTGTKKPLAKLHKNKKWVVVANKAGTKIKTLDVIDGSTVSSKTLLNKKQSKVKLYRKNYYTKNNKNDVIIVTRKKGQIRTTHFTFKPKTGKIGGKDTKLFETYKQDNFKMKKKDKYVSIKNGKNSLLVKYLLNKKGNLKNI
ncbi:MAG: DUF5011 domain-containing protein [bacterium]|nr:DUF5011 domain-containing protein [bacterium]